MVRSLAWLAPALVVALVATATLAGAHADLVSARPAPFSELTRAPATLELTFSERLEDRYTGVEVADANGTDHVEEWTIDEATRSRVTVTLAGLADGVYTVRWQSLSVDTHTNRGQYLLAINASLEGAAPNTTTGPDDAARSQASPGEVLARTAGFLGAALAAGIPLFLVMAGELDLPPARRRWLEGASLAGAAIAALAAVALAASIGGRIDAPISAVFATSSGTWLMRRTVLHAGAALAFALLLAPGLGGLRAQLLGAGSTLSILALLTTSLGGHAAAIAPGLSLPVLADWAHLVAVSFWVGGIASLGLLLWAREDTDEVPDLVRRFSPLAVFAVAVIVATGTYASLLHLDRWGELFSSAYGWALVTKVLLLLPLTALGAFNRYIVLPRLATGVRGKALRRLRRSVASEAALMAVVLLAAGTLTSNAPPSTLPDAPTGPDSGETPTGVVHRFNESGYAFVVLVHPSPPRVGVQHIVVEVTPPEQGLPENVAVILNLRPPSDRAGEGKATELARDGNTTSWETSGPHFTEQGTWRVQVALQGKGTFVSERFELEVGPPG